MPSSSSKGLLTRQSSSSKSLTRLRAMSSQAELRAEEFNKKSTERLEKELMFQLKAKKAAEERAAIARGEARAKRLRDDDDAKAFHDDPERAARKRLKAARLAARLAAHPYKKLTLETARANAAQLPLCDDADGEAEYDARDLYDLVWAPPPSRPAGDESASAAVDATDGAACGDDFDEGAPPEEVRRLAQLAAARPGVAPRGGALDAALAALHAAGHDADAAAAALAGRPVSREQEEDEQRRAPRCSPRGAATAGAVAALFASRGIHVKAHFSDVAAELASTSEEFQRGTRAQRAAAHRREALGEVRARACSRAAASLFLWVTIVMHARPGSHVLLRPIQTRARVRCRQEAQPSAAARRRHGIF